ncbi:Ribonuclease H domain [Arabidopsis suecica]|uniref:Ribonuclease H domain n=1 Tax=Arabidopsis suecica TaxID=45249 RepID=A0A8T2CJT4_ARASU|nr:Ribonuclease H domain [Arabidopsis suecica]
MLPPPSSSSLHHHLHHSIVINSPPPSSSPSPPSSSPPSSSSSSSSPSSSSSSSSSKYLNEVDEETCVCCTDAAWNATSKAAGFGWTFSRSVGSPNEGSEANFHIRSALTAEATAIRYALQQALTLGIGKISIASDAKQVIEAINSENPPVELHGIHHVILALSLNFSAISFNFIPREHKM